MRFDSRVTTTYGEEAPTYYVIAEGGTAPTKKHPSRIAAEREASRLAEKHPGLLFEVVKLKRAVRFDGEAGVSPQVTQLDFAKQIAARNDAGMKAGIWVRVKDSHYEHAGAIGTISRLGEGTDSSVYVHLNGADVRFSPTSLICLTGGAEARMRGTDQQEAEYRSAQRTEQVRSSGEARPIGQILAGVLLGLLSRREEEERAAAVATAVAAPPMFKAGQSVLIMISEQMGVLPGLAVPATFDRVSALPDMVWVRMVTQENRDGELLEVHISKVFSEEDERFAPFFS